MRDVVKIDDKPVHDPKRSRRRKKRVALYFFLLLIAALAIGVILSVTVLFGVDNIVVSGDVDYSDESVIKASGISKGDNLVRLDAKAAERRILSSMVYIEEADVSKKYPGTIEIELVRCIPCASVDYNGQYILISGKGKILDVVKDADPMLPLIRGFDPENADLGSYLKSKNEKKTEAYPQILEAAAKNDKDKLTLIDMTDEYSIVLNFGGRVDFELGNTSDIAYKMNLAGTVLDDLDPDKTGTMIMVGGNQIAFRGGIVKNGGRKPVAVTTQPKAAQPQYVDEDEDGYDDNTGELVEDIIARAQQGAQGQRPIPDNGGEAEELPQEENAENNEEEIPDDYAPDEGNGGEEQPAEDGGGYENDEGYAE